MGNACYIKFWAFLLSVYTQVPTAHSLCRNPPKRTEDFDAMNGQWVRVHTLTEGKPKS